MQSDQEIGRPTTSQSERAERISAVSCRRSTRFLLLPFVLLVVVFNPHRPHRLCGRGPLLGGASVVLVLSFRWVSSCGGSPLFLPCLLLDRRFLAWRLLLSSHRLRPSFRATLLACGSLCWRLLRWQNPFGREKVAKQWANATTRGDFAARPSQEGLGGHTTPSMGI